MTASLFTNSQIFGSSMEILAPNPNHLDCAKLEATHSSKSEKFVTEYALEVKSYIEKLASKHEWAKILLSDFDAHQKNSDISPNILWHLILRAQAGQSVGRISLKEQMFFKIIAPLGDFMAEFLEKNAWKTEETSTPIINKFMRFSPNLTMTSPMYDLDNAPVSKEIQVRPILNKAFLQHKELLKSIIHEEYLTAIPQFLSTRPLNAHGVEDISPLGFTLHDLTHGLFNQRRLIMKVCLDKGYPSGGVTHYPPAHNQLISENLEKLLEALDPDTIPEHKKHLEGFFLLTHELFSSFRPVFSQNTFSSVLASMKTEQYFPTLDEYLLLTNIGEDPVKHETIYEALMPKFPPEYKLESEISSLFIKIAVRNQSGEIRSKLLIQTLYYLYDEAMDNLKDIEKIEGTLGLELKLGFNPLDPINGDKEKAMNLINAINTKRSEYVNGFLDWAIEEAKNKHDALYQERLNQIHQQYYPAHYQERLNQMQADMEEAQSGNLKAEQEPIHK